MVILKKARKLLITKKTRPARWVEFFFSASWKVHEEQLFCGTASFCPPGKAGEGSQLNKNDTSRLKHGFTDVYR